MFGIRRHPNPLVCPVRAIETYMAVAHIIGINLRQVYLFRPTNQKGSVVDKPFEYQAADVHLKFYLRLAGIDNGETLHGFRSGCALTLAFSGSALADIMSCWLEGELYSDLSHETRQCPPCRCSCRSVGLPPRVRGKGSQRLHRLQSS